VTGVAEILRQRARGGTRSSQNRFDDGAKVALCIEGGAMRGVVAAGMVAALEELGLTGAFDAVYGSSAGAICGAYFLAGQAERGATIFTEDINNRRFASRLRTFTRWPIVNLAYLVDEVMVAVKPLDTARVLASSTPLTVVATDVASAATALLSDFIDGDELRSALRAGATMPIIAGPPHPFRGRRYFDASLTEPIPLPSADQGGFTHIVVLLTRPRGVPRAVSAFDRLVVGPRLARVSGPLAEGYLARTAPYASLQDQIASGRSTSGASVLGIRPDLTVGKLERDRSRLLAGAASGRAAVLAALGT
jgi:predicted patatin/cPLA2 family phospholipase